MNLPVLSDLVRRVTRGSLLLALAATSVAAAWGPPDAAQLARLERALASQHAQYDPAERMIRRPFSSPGYHTTLQGGWVHPTRDSLAYAVGLLDTGRAADLARAVDVIRRVVALQDANPDSRTYGIWSWFLEEPLEKMSPPDWNWADFNGVSLLQISLDHRARLPTDVARTVDDAILHACRSIKKRNVSPSYTNIAIMGTYVTLVAGEHLDQPEFRLYGLERLQRFADYTAENGAFEEYNSPTYTIIALLELSRLQAHVRDTAARALLAPLVRLAWEELAQHFHAPTRQWAGPHSRAYSSLLAGSTLGLIQRGTGGRVDFGADEPGREDLRLPLHCPPDLEPRFRALPEARTVTETFVRRSGTIGTTYLHPQYALGTINRGDLWNQRRALLLHFGSAARPGYLQLRFLKNGYDFSSAIFTGAQREGLVVGAVNVITNGGDTHLSLDKVKAGKILARDLRLRFEFGGPAVTEVRINSESATHAVVAAGELGLSFDLLRARWDGREAIFSAGGHADRRWLDVVLHEGAEREINLNEVTEAIVGFVLSVGPHGAARAEVADGRLQLACDGLSVSAAVRPYARK